MSQVTFAIIAAALIGAGNAINNAMGQNGVTLEPVNGGDPTTEPAKRGRKPNADKPAAATESAPAEATGKTYEELRAIIQPLVEGGQGEDVKKVITKYAAGGLKELVNLPQHHAAFAKDIAALAY